MMNAMGAKVEEICESILGHPVKFSVEDETMDQVFKEGPIHNSQPEVKDVAEHVHL
jgi:hypothetical protein